MQIELTEVDASSHQRKIVLDKLPVMIGQGPDSSVRLEDHWVSPYHCEINAVQGTLVVRDLGSMLGTFVNGLNVSTALLMPGDKLTIGITSFLVDYEQRQAKRSAMVPAASPPAEAEVTRPAQLGTLHREAPPQSHRGFFRRLLARAFSPFGRKSRAAG